MTAKLPSTFSEQEICTFLQHFPVAIDVERQGSHYVWSVAGDKGIEITFLGAAQVAVARAFAYQAEWAHWQERSDLRHDREDLREVLEPLINVSRQIVDQPAVVQIAGALTTFRDVVERAARIFTRTANNVLPESETEKPGRILPQQP